MRDTGLATVARAKAASTGIGHPIFLPQERIEDAATLPVLMHNAGLVEEETIHLLATTAVNIVGARNNGRVIIASSPSAHYIYAAAFWVEAYGHRCVQSVWIEPEYRGLGGARHVRTGKHVVTDLEGSPFSMSDLLGSMLREVGVRCALNPMSTQGKAWAKRLGFRARNL